MCLPTGSLANQILGRVCGTKCFPSWLAGLLPGWQSEDQRCTGSFSTHCSDGDQVKETEKYEISGHLISKQYFLLQTRAFALTVVILKPCSRLGDVNTYDDLILCMRNQCTYTRPYFNGPGNEANTSTSFNLEG